MGAVRGPLRPRRAEAAAARSAAALVAGAGARVMPRRSSAAAVVPFEDPASAASGPPGPGDLGPMAGTRLDRLCAACEIPASTMRALCAQGKGPAIFTIGRLIFCLVEDWND